LAFVVLAGSQVAIAPSGAATSFAAPKTQPAGGAGAAQAAQTYGQWVAALAEPNMEGRGAGTAGLDKARDFLAEHYRRLGLAAPFGKSFAQPVEIPMGVKVEKQELAICDANGTRLPAPQPGDFAVLGYSASKGFSAPAVFVGYGLVAKEHSYDSYAGADKDALKGKVAVAFRFEPQDKDGKSLWASKGGEPWSAGAGLLFKAQWAGLRGAEALLVVNPPSQQSADPPRSAGPMPGGRIPMIYISPKLFEGLLKAGGAKDPPAAAKRLQELADEGKGGIEPLNATVQGEVKIQPGKGTIHNVAGLLPGNGALASQCVIVAAHYDHLGFTEQGSGKDRKRIIYPGGDDNASGTAGVMMLAQWFAARAAESNAPASRRSILFVNFAGEEVGMHGSRYLADHLGDLGIKPGQVVAMINLDMIGRSRDGQVIVFGTGSGEGLASIVDQAAKETKVDARTVGLSFSTSDHAAFYARKIPVLFLHTGINLDMHSPRDTAEKINSAGAVGILRLAESIIGRFWTEPKTPAFAAGKGEVSQDSTAFLGVSPGMGDAQGAGCSIESVVDGSPAAAAGLKAGDRIVQWNDTKIANGGSLFEVVRKCKPGDKATLKVERDGKTIDLQATLGKR
jgi:sulfur carrier protein ThiS